MIRPRFLTAEDRAWLLKIVRRPSEMHGSARRANAMLLLDDGLSCEAIAKVLYLDDDTVRGWYELWLAGGRESLSSFGFKGAPRSLLPDQEASLVTDLREKLFLTSRAIRAHIMDRFDIRFSHSGIIKYLNRLGFEYKKPKALPAGADVAAQRAFVTGYERLMTGLEADEVVYFADAVHPEYQSRPTHGWIMRGDKLAIKRTTGRKRLNLHGALCLEDFDCQIVEAQTVSTVTTLRLLQNLANRHPAKRQIHVFLDNARYHHAREVKAWLAKPNCKIRLHFLPAYAPNLNAIERLWAVMHRNVTHNKHHASYDDFTEAILTFFRKTLPQNWKSFRDTVSDNFHIIDHAKFRVLS